MPGNGTHDDKLIVIKNMEAPSSWDASGDIYAVSVFSLQDGNLLHDYKASRYFDMGADMENGHEIRAFIYPYKTRAQIENAWRSPAFQAVHASSSIDGAIQKKTFLYDGDAEPILQATGRSYLIKGDVVTVRDSVAGWCKASYNTGKRVLIKWVNCSDIQFLEGKGGYAACIDGADGVHIEMTTCIRHEIDRINISIENHLTAAERDQSIKGLWEELSESTKIWVHSMNTSCNIYQVMGGQRAELLNKICILEEVKFRESFIKSILIEAQI
jgi:hypothetical protein